MKIGYIGLGDMGGALARRLLLKHQLMVYDLNSQSVSRMVALGALAVEDLRNMAVSCDVIFTCLPTSSHVHTVIFGPDGLLPQLKPGTLLIDQSTGDPRLTRTMAEELARRDVHLIDAPVSGGAVGAEAGTIAIMVGASPQQFALAYSILASISPNVFHAGGLGTGHVIKLVNNLISGAQRLLTLEGVALAMKNGIEPGNACSMLAAGGAKNGFLERALPREVLQGNLDVGFTLTLMHKDIRLACGLGEESGVPMFFGNLTREMYQMCISLKGQDARVNTSALVMDELAGTSMVPPM